MSTKTFHRTGRFLLSCLTVLSLILVPLGPGFRSDAARATGTVKNRVLNVRASASTSSAIVCKLSQGTKVNIISETTGDDGLKWYDVYFAYNGDAKEGFVRADLLNVSGSVSSGSGNGSSGSTGSPGKYIKPNVAIVRTAASKKSDIRSRLEKGTSVTVLSAQTGNDDGKTWYKISCTRDGASLEGYVRGDLLTDTNPGGASAGTTDVSGTRYVRVNVVRVRTYASTDGDIRSRLSRGTPVTLISSKTGSDGKTWYKVSYTDGGYQLNGYIRSDMLTNENTGSSAGSSAGSSIANTPASVKPVVANIRTISSTNGDIRSKLSQGTGVTILLEVTGEDGKKWYKISYSLNGISMEGYIRSDLLNVGVSGTGSSGSASSSGSSGNSNAVAKVRTIPSPYGDIRATLQNGTKVTILEEVIGEDTEKWSKISFTQDGKTLEGYVPSSMLK